MPSNALTDLIVAFLHKVTGPRHYHRCGCRGGRRHRHETVAQQIHHRCLRSRHTDEYWSSPHPLPSTSRLTGRCSQTSMPIQGVIRADRASFTIGIVPTGLHRSMIHRHRDARGRREERMMMMSVRSRWSPASLGRQ
jgi:hypothetical protein